MSRLSLLLLAGISLLVGLQAAWARADGGGKFSRLSSRAAAVLENRQAQRRIPQAAKPDDTLVKLVLEADDMMVLDNFLQQDGVAVQSRTTEIRQLLLPRGRMKKLAARLPQGVRARLPFPHHAASVESQGVAIMGADDYHALGIDGTGVKIGVIDLGFTGYQDAQASGDLPTGAALTITDYTGTGLGGDKLAHAIDGINTDKLPGYSYARGNYFTYSGKSPFTSLIYPLPDWEELERKLVRLPSMNKVARRIVRIMVGYATEVDMDGSGRILVSRELREFAGLEKQAVLIGQGNKFELWDEATWVEKRDEWLADEEDGELPADLESLSF